jgi:DNA-binding MarR family transcriptional regulator
VIVGRKELPVEKKREISDLECHVGYWMRFVSNHVTHAFKRKLEGKEVTVAEWALMRQMFDAGPTNPSHLAEQMGMTRGAISKLIDRLCDKGLVERTSLKTDRRFQTVALTPKGRRLVPALADLADSNDREFFGHLSERQQSEIMFMLKDIVDRHGWKAVPVD